MTEGRKTFQSLFILVLFFVCFSGIAEGQSIKIRATNGVSDSDSSVFFCFRSSETEITTILNNLNYGDVSSYLYLNGSTEWNIGVSLLPSCGDLITSLNATLNPTYTYTISYVGALANATESLILYNYTAPSAASTGACKINLYFQAENTTDVNFVLFSPGTSSSSFSIIEYDLYEATGYSTANSVGALNGTVIYQFYDSRYSITGVSYRFNYTFVEKKSYSAFAWGVLDHYDTTSLKVVIVQDDDNDNDDVDASTGTSIYNIQDDDGDGDDEWIWITSTVVLAVVSASFLFVFVAIGFLYIRNRKNSAYQEFNY